MELITFGYKHFIESTVHIHKNRQLVCDCIVAYRMFEYKDFGPVTFDLLSIWNKEEETDVREVVDNVFETPNTQEEEEITITQHKTTQHKYPIYNKNVRNKVSYKMFCEFSREQQLEELDKIKSIPQEDWDMNQRYIVNYHQGIMKSK